MQKKFEQFLKKPFYSLLLIFVLLSGGFIGLRNMPVDYFPGLKYPLLNVITQYPGVSPHDMEILITRPIENQLQGIRGVYRTSSITSLGISQVTVEFSQGYNLLAARQLVAASLSQLSGQLPPEVQPVIDNLGSRMQQIISFTFVNDRIPQTDLRQIIQYRLMPALHAVPGISRIDVFGGKRLAYIVEPDPNALRRLQLSMEDLALLLKKNNVTTSGRYLQDGYLDIPIRGNGLIHSIHDLRLTAVSKTANGLPIFLKDIANVHRGSLPEHYLVHSNHHPAVALIIQKEDGYGTIETARAIEHQLEQLRSILPTGTTIHKFYDQSEILSESLKGVNHEMLFGALLAMLALFLFLRRLQLMLIVSMTIPLALLAAFMWMYFSDFSLNMMTLGALTLSIGMVVDDSIIVMENIQRYREEGNPLLPAVLQGTRQILGADITGTLTTFCVFIPLLFIGGFLRDLVLPFGLTIGYALFASLLISITLIPAMIHWKGGTPPPASTRPLFLEKIITWNDRLFSWSMKHKTKTFVALALLLLASGAILPLLNPTTMLPPIDEGALLIEYLLRPGVSLKESYRVADQLINEIEKIPDVDNIYLKIGSPENSYYIETVNHGEFLIKLKPRQKRTQSISALMAALKQKFSALNGVVLLYHQPTQEKIDESFSGLPAFFGVSVSGENLDSLSRLSARVENVMRKSSGLHNIINNARFTVPQIEVTPDRARLAYFGLNTYQLMKQLSLGVGGGVVARFVNEQTPVSVFLRLPEKQRNNLDELRNLPIKTPRGDYIPLQQLAKIQMHNILPVITHLNGQREITLIAEPEGNLWSIVNHLKQELQSLRFPVGYTYQIRGQYQTVLQSVKSFALVILAAVILVYLILYLQFESLWQPFVILLKIPLDFIGVFLALLLTHQTLNISVALGILTLVGVSVNNAIILIDMVNHLRKDAGISLEQALRQAVHLRIRPILMTGLTTILGLLPAAIGFGIGSKIHQPFAITVIGGMVTGIIFSLNVIPAIYYVFARRVH